MKKFICLFAAFFLYCNALVAQSGGPIGSTGLNWEFDGVNTLTISATAGIKTMPNFDNSSNRPDWEADKDNIEYVIIEEGVASIGDNAFYNHGNLNSVEISSSVTAIGEGTFRSCYSLTDINIPNSVTSIGSGAFEGCNSLIHINIPNSVTWIGYSAFEGCNSLIQINIPNSVSSIGPHTFSSCLSLTHINIPNSVFTIGDYAFSNCSKLTQINIPNSVFLFGYGVFMGCESLTQIDIPNSVTSIEDYTFLDCKKLTQINIPNSITEIGRNAFFNCDILENVFVYAENPPSLGTDVFGGTTPVSSATLYVPHDSKSKYETTSQWDSFGNTKSIYTISFNPNGGTVQPKTKGVPEDFLLVYPSGDFPVPVRAGYIFDGWFDDIQGGSLIPANKRANSHIEIFAHWIDVNDFVARIASQPQSAAVCTGFDSHTLSVTALGLNISYQWYRDGQPIQGATGSRYTISNIQAGFSADFHVVVTGMYGTAQSHSANVRTVTPFPATLEFAETPTGTLTLKQDYTFSVKNYPDISTCLWSSDKGSIIFSSKDGKSVTVRFTETGTDVIHATFVHGCTTGYGSKTIDFPVTVEAYTGIDFIENASLTAYPNPTDGIITVAGTAAGEEIAIFSLTGTKLATFTAEPDNTTIDISNLPKAIYILRTNTKAIKIIKNN